MDRTRAMLAHLTWFDDLWKAVLANRELRADQIARDDRCAIGTWLRGEARAFVDRPEYAALDAVHKRYHACAAQAVARAQAGTLEALRMLELGGECSELSVEFLDRCQDLFRHIDRERARKDGASAGAGAKSGTGNEPGPQDAQSQDAPSQDG